MPEFPHSASAGTVSRGILGKGTVRISDIGVRTSSIEEESNIQAHSHVAFAMKAKTGNSGSGIFNRNGELISIERSAVGPPVKNGVSKVVSTGNALAGLIEYANKIRKSLGLAEMDSRGTGIVFGPSRESLMTEALKVQQRQMIPISSASTSFVASNVL